MYTTPEVRELGTVSAFTLGSTRPIGSGTKANNNSADQYDSNPVTAGIYGYGSPCSVQLPGTTYNCSG